MAADAQVRHVSPDVVVPDADHLILNPLVGRFEIDLSDPNVRHSVPGVEAKRRRRYSSP